MASASALSNMNSTLSAYRNSKAFFSFSSPEPRSGGGSGGVVRCFPKRMVVSMKAAGMDGRDSLDHLQRVLVGKPKQQQQPPQPKRRVVQSNPIAGLWDRFPSARTVQQMMETMDRIMEDPFAYSTDAFPPPLSAEENVGNYRRGGRTPWEIKEREGEYRMRFDVPGMTRKDVKVCVEERLLVVRAEKAAPPKEEGEAGEVEEEEWPASSYGRYNSRIALPENVDVEKIKAEVRDGVLYITVPKVSASAKVLDIDVQ